MQYARRKAVELGVGQVQMRNGPADVLHICGQIPFPETADELCAVVSDIDADLDIHLSGHTTEHEVKAVSECGEPARYRIVHFVRNAYGAMVAN